MAQNGTRQTTIPSIRSELREWYTVDVGHNKYVYAGKTYNHIVKKDGVKIYTGYVIEVTASEGCLIVQDVDHSLWLLFQEDKR
jgi:hypothetical protein